MTNTIARTTVPQVLLKDYDKIAKTNGNNVIDTAKEVEKFKDKVNDAYNYGEITLDKQHKQLRLSFKALSQNSRRYTRRVKFLGMPDSIKGFGTIKDKMPEWVKGEYDD